MDSTNIISTPNFDKINPISCINGKLRKLHKLINTSYMDIYKPYGLRGSMVSILFVIGKRKGISQKDVAEALLLDQSTMSRDLKKLVHKGWVIINKSSDSRKSALSLSKNGCLLLEEIAPLWHELHTKVSLLLGSFNIHTIDNITTAIRTNQKNLKAQ
jgi:DNA-binding MarR family transcriptional regulator